MPIKTRIDMLATGIKTPVGIKIMGDNLDSLSAIGERIESTVRRLKGTLSVYSERVVGGNYVDFEIRRHEIARYGLTVGDVQDIFMSAVGGMNITSTVEGLERYPVNVRYPRELRDDVQIPRPIRLVLHRQLRPQNILPCHICRFRRRILIKNEIISHRCEKRRRPQDLLGNS